MPYPQVITDYSLLFADCRLGVAGINGISDSDRFRGQLLKLQLKHRPRDDVNHRITMELFVPGSFYTDARNDVALWLRYGINHRW